MARWYHAACYDGKDGDSKPGPPGEVGESVKTAQSPLGHSDLETTLNTHMHAIPDSQRRAVERVAEVLFPDVPNFSPDSKEPGRVN